MTTTNYYGAGTRSSLIVGDAPQSAPARIARAAVPVDRWGPIQFQRKLGAGVYAFDCAGHGGVVALDSLAVRRPDSTIDDRELERLTTDHAERFTIAEVAGGTRCADGRRRRLMNTADWRVPFADHYHRGAIYEHDCAWSIAALAFVADFTSAGGWSNIADRRTVDELAFDTVARWFR